MRCLTLREARLLLRESARRSFLQTGKQLHAVLTTTGLSRTPNSFIANTLFQFYASCDDTASAHQLFDEIPLSMKDTVDWTTMISSYARGKLPVKAIRLFVEMRKEYVEADDVTMICVFGVCAKLVDLGFGVQGHGYAKKMGITGCVKVCNALMDMYGKCGLLGEARRVFDEIKDKSVVSWTVFLDAVVKCQGVEIGRKVFDEMPDRNAVAWTVMVSGYVGNGFTDKAFQLLSEMVFSCGHDLNFVTLCAILSACAQSGDLAIGKWVHMYVLKRIMGQEHQDCVMVGTALVDMYAKCGRIDHSMRIFKSMPEKNVVTWNAMFSGLAMHGKGRMVTEMFPEMVRDVKPDDLTFMAVLSACSHSGLVEQGWSYFKNIQSYGSKPKIEHYACMVDLLGRAGRLEEAEILIKRMPVRPNEVVLGSLLGSCSVHGKLNIAERVIKELIQIDPGNTEYHVLLSNMYAVEGREKSSELIRGNLRNQGIRKVPGMSSIHVGGSFHRFSSGDKSHRQTEEIYRKLDEMIRRLRSAGYVPDVSIQRLTGDCDLEEKERGLFSHSEKLAVCFGLMCTKPGTPLYVFKNLRICRDCHVAMKIASKVYVREIVIRDRNRFHCFRDGLCSCSDYW